MMFKGAVTLDQMQSKFPAIFATSEKETLSEKYLYIPTFKLIEGLVRQGFEIIGAKQSRTNTTSSREHAKHVVYLSHQSLGRHGMKVGEELPMLALTNSHNGTSAFAIDTAFFRLACSNGLLMPTSSMSSARIIHKSGMERDVVEAATNVVQAFPEQVRQVEAMKAIVLNRDEQLLLAESARNLIFDETAVELNSKVGVNLSEKLLTVRRWDDKKADLWTTFNVIQENAIKGGIRVVTQNEAGERSMRKTRPVNSIDRDAKLNKELMALAQKFQALKVG